MFHGLLKRRSPSWSAAACAPCRFLRHRKGSAALEFALVVPVLVLFVVGVIEFSITMYYSSILEGAINAAARTGKTGYCGGAINTGTTGTTCVYNIVKSKVSGAMNPNNLTIYAQDFGSSYTNLGTINCSNAANATNPCSVGGPGDLVEYSVTYPFQMVLLKYIMGNAASGNSLNISAFALVKNENYPTQ